MYIHCPQDFSSGQLLCKVLSLENCASVLEINPDILTQPFLTRKLSTSFCTAREMPGMGVLGEHHQVWPWGQQTRERAGALPSETGSEVGASLREEKVSKRMRTSG